MKKEIKYYVLNPSLESESSKKRFFTDSAIEGGRFKRYDKVTGKKNEDRFLKKSVNLVMFNNDDMIMNFVDMTKPERVLFMYIAKQLQPDTDYVYINRKQCMDMFNYTSYSGLSNAINKFLDWEYIFKAIQKNKYWINTELFYKGDIVKMWLTTNNYEIDSVGKQSIIDLGIKNSVNRLQNYINYLKSCDVWEVYLTNTDLKQFCAIRSYQSKIIDTLVEKREIELIDFDKSLYRIIL